jgi:hypothetical protein
MNPTIESLESRRLLAGHLAGPSVIGFVDRLVAKAQGITDPAVVADVAAVKSDQAAVANAAATVREQTSDTRATLKDAITSSFQTLKADRQAVRNAHDDLTALAAARDKLKADRDKAHDDISAARDGVKADAIDAKAALKDATARLIADVKQLRVDLQNAGVIPAPSTPPPTAGGIDNTGGGGGGGTTAEPPHPIQHDVTLTPEQAQSAADAIKAAAANVSGIDQDAVTKLTDDLVAAASDSSITPDERTQLRADAKAVLQGVSPSDIRTIAGSLRDVIGPAAASSNYRGFRG